jgi:hypothetical protein
VTEQNPHIIEAVPVLPAHLTWIRMSDDTTAEISRRATTAGELAAILALLPAETPLLTDGYEGGLTPLGAITVTEVQQLDRDSDQAGYLGEYETVDEAQRQAALSPDDPEIAVGGIAPPRLVGAPLYALVLHREGR